MSKEDEQYMTKINIKERIEQEEKKKITPLFIGIVLIFIISILLNIILGVSLLIRIISGAMLFLIAVYIGVEWYRAYYI